MIKEEIALIYEQTEKIKEIIEEFKTEAEYLDKLFRKGKKQGPINLQGKVAWE